jgi:hypothetical protein
VPEFSRWPGTRRNRLPSEVQDLLTVDDEDRIALQEVPHVLAEAQRMDRHLVARHRLVLLGALLGVEDAELADPRRILRRVDLALRLGGELLEDGARVAEDRHVDVAVLTHPGRVDVDADDLHVLSEARRPRELDDPVEPGADHETDVRFLECESPGIEKRQRIVLRHRAT